MKEVAVRKEEAAKAQAVLNELKQKLQKKGSDDDDTGQGEHDDDGDDDDRQNQENTEKSVEAIAIAAAGGTPTRKPNGYAPCSPTR